MSHSSKKLPRLLHPLLFHSPLHPLPFIYSVFSPSITPLRSSSTSRTLCTSSLSPSITPLRSTSTSGTSSRTSFSEFNYRKLSYYHPKMKSILEPRPNDALELEKLDVEPEKVEDFTPPGAVTEMKLAITRNPLPNSKAPSFCVHNFRAAYKDSDGCIVHLIREQPLPKEIERNPLLKRAMEQSKEVNDEDLKEHGIEKADVEKIWFHWSRERERTEALWAHSLSKHAKFSFGDYIPAYASTTYKLAKPIIEGEEGHPGLGEFLLQEGFEVGKYHDVADLLVSLKRFFGVDVLPTFIHQSGVHPSLFEIAVLTTKDGTKRIDHPMVSKVPKGKFLMRHL